MTTLHSAPTPLPIELRAYLCYYALIVVLSWLMRSDKTTDSVKPVLVCYQALFPGAGKA